jgi:phage tail sheath gpL-like
MSQAKNPYVSITKQSASLPAGVDTQKLLVIGQKLSTGSAIEKTLYTDIERSDIDDKFDNQSALGSALNAVFDVFDQAPSPNLPRIDVIPLEDAGGATKSKATVTFSGTADKNGTLNFNIMGEDVALTIAVDDDPSTDTAADLAAEIDLLELPVTVTDNGDGSVDIEAKNGGTIFNTATIKIDGLAKSGSDYYLGSLKVELTPFSAGATDPTLTSLLDVVSKIRYQTMTYPYEYGTSLATDFLDSRFNVANAIKDGVAILKGTDAKADLVSVLDALNSKNLVILCNKEVEEDNFDGGEDLELDFVAAARVAATRAVRLMTDANIVNFTPASVRGDLDGFGGMHIASLPYANTPIFGSPIQPDGRGWTDTEKADLFTAGGCIMGNNNAGNQVILDKIRTTYKTDAAGNVDTTWKYLNTVDTLSVSAEYIFNNLKSDYAQSRLTSGNLVRGYSMTNEEDFVSKMLDYFETLGDYALVPKSKEASKFFTDNMSVTISLVLGRITSSNEFPIVTQLREILSTLKTNFSSSF